MSQILAKFEDRLGKLEETILPVYSVTKTLQRQQHNLEATLGCLESVLSHYSISQEVCNIIHMGPNTDNIDRFLEALDKLQNAKEYFLNNTTSVELENVTSLFNTGCDQLNNYFKNLLKKHSAPLRPIDLLDLIYQEDDSSSSEDFPSSIKQISPKTREELQRIANWLDQNLSREFLTVYSEDRSDVILKSLQLLKDHQKSGSWGNEALKPKYYGRASISVESTKKTATVRLQNIFERKANKMLLKASQTLGQSTGLMLKKPMLNLSSDFLNDEGMFSDINNDQELEKYLVLLLGLQKLLVWERQLMNDIIPSSRQNDVFSNLALASIDMIVKDAEVISCLLRLRILHITLHF
jgi:exocyst complex protein 7